MVAEEDEQRSQGKGFAGLSSLVSDLDTTLPLPAKQEAAGSGASSSAERPTASQDAQPDPWQQPYQAPSQPFSGSSGGKWVLRIAAVIGVLWLVWQSDKSPTSPAPAYSPPAQSATPRYSPPAEPQAPSRPQESMPPVGQNLMLSTAQIHYCLTEDIRMEGAKSALNNYSDSDVDRFNAMVADYNSRCGSFRYRSGALESARRDIEPYRSQLQSEGRSRFARPSTGSLSAPVPSRPASNATVQAIQRSSSTRDAENFRTCISGDYPSLCKHNLLTPNEAVQVAAAERGANFQTCISGDYPSLCKHNLLTPSEATQVAAAERRANLQTCISGDYPSLCKHNLLTPTEATQVAAAERRANFQTCISGDYPSLCKHSLLNAEEVARVAEAERRARSR